MPISLSQYVYCSIGSSYLLIRRWKRRATKRPFPKIEHFNGHTRHRPNHTLMCAHRDCYATSNSSDCLRRTHDDICQEIQLYGRQICGDTRAVAHVGHVAPS